MGKHKKAILAGVLAASLFGAVDADAQQRRATHVNPTRGASGISLQKARTNGVNQLPSAGIRLPPGNRQSAGDLPGRGLSNPGYNGGVARSVRPDVIPNDPRWGPHQYGDRNFDRSFPRGFFGPRRPFGGGHDWFAWLSIGVDFIDFEFLSRYVLIEYINARHAFPVFYGAPQLGFFTHHGLWLYGYQCDRALPCAVPCAPGTIGVYDGDEMQWGPRARENKNRLEQEMAQLEQQPSAQAPEVPVAPPTAPQAPAAQAQPTAVQPSLSRYSSPWEDGNPIPCEQQMQGELLAYLSSKLGRDYSIAQQKKLWEYNGRDFAPDVTVFDRFGRAVAYFELQHAYDSDKTDKTLENTVLQYSREKNDPRLVVVPKEITTPDGIRNYVDRALSTLIGQ